MSLTALPTGGLRDSVEEFWDADVLRDCLRRGRETSPGEFLERLRGYLGASGRMYAAPSGREALRAFLHGSRHPKSGDRVLACSFNCTAVSEAIQQAGFVPETFDLADRSGRFDWERVASQIGDHHHAVIVPHLFGAPTDFRPLLTTAARHGVLVIEDCAHTLGGKIGDEAAGAVGDAAYFSFSFDKPISLGGGGALLVNRADCPFTYSTRPLPFAEERAELQRFVRYLRQRRRGSTRPGLLSRARRRLMPERTLEFVLANGFGRLRAALGSWQLGRYAEVSRRRNANASLLNDVPGWRSWRTDPDTTVAWIRMKLVPDKPCDVASVVRPLQAVGLRVGGFNWPTTLDEALSQQQRPNAHYLARYAVDAPIHQEMTEPELRLIASTLAEVPA
jgi:dTDP-4-amino-4,6-dideoxygalactose transaminase